ncbi:hypothetical protein F4861DRAFT_488807 [Xylaria intraflava]|nr:hypothetical protein F4861DRAFT_488807 [Xylaria intraflava]
MDLSTPHRSPWLLCLGAIQAFFSLAFAQFPWAAAIPRTGWTAEADSFQPGFEPFKAIDGNSSNIWHTAFYPITAPLPHYIQVDMKKLYVINGISYQPRQDASSNGNIGQHTVTVSNDGSSWSSPVQFGTWLDDKTTKSTFFSNTTARYVRITAQTEAQGTNRQWSSIDELNIYSPDPNFNASSFRPPSTSLGRWDQTVVLPIVPVAGAVSAQGDVIFWSSFRPDEFSGGGGQTLTAQWTPSSQEVTQRTVTETHHDMFCPGICLDANGRITVTGGRDSKNTSTYGPQNADWMSKAEMVVGRGYHSTVTIGDGRIFAIGGSWSGGRGGKNGEIYSPAANRWTSLPGCTVAPMLTADPLGAYRADNHAWLFAYKDNSVFQAGPSKAMNWYKVSSLPGSYQDAGTRAADGDAMCGNAVMFDAISGSILTTGGAPAYDNSSATPNTHLIELGEVGVVPAVTALSDMAHARIFANAVVLPDGTVLVVGGQSFGVVFTDTTPVFPAELWDPRTREWRTLASIAVPRTYHSIALLLPDATVLAGGGGLCGTGCAQNHFDLQVFLPPYLFNSDGTRARRPVISSVSATDLLPGGLLTIATTQIVESFALIRYGSVTHTVNTDQRRVPLSVVGVSGSTYVVDLPVDPGIMIPGYWMLFAIDGAGVPSVATRIKILDVLNGHEEI